MLQKINISNFKNSAGTIQELQLTYQTFGREIGTAPIVMVNHALTGNSEVTGKNGWWQEIIGLDKSIDLQEYTVLAFNNPGNGFDGVESHLLLNYKDFTLRDIAKIYSEALKQLGISKIYAGIGGSIGGALLWEQAVLDPDLFEHLIPIATDYKATPWVKAQCKVQEQILNNSVNPVADARMHAMTIYRSPESFISKFTSNQNNTNGTGNIEDWLEHHGKQLENRYQLAAYKLMNHLLSTSDISLGSGDHLNAASKISGDIHIITINSDGLFTANENWDTYVNLSLIKENISIHEIRSIHGHDAFLIETSQVASFLNPIFNHSNKQNENNKHSAFRSR
ncbi:homoserine O-acetyltransferase [Gillisia mitskevichiae]|uniref:Homoserine O-acetyltransferase n=1 Tax=Gillisia mitskevichiae TaxID=270921 RepID=A0A495Q017_9FLAO|nr:alpha/beta fold hydrolase [Gillisia mitskevichiae]RKS56117.1 homoserine O-acetyltransferase [Gillisia mitskevichiae]